MMQATTARGQQVANLLDAPMAPRANPSAAAAATGDLPATPTPAAPAPDVAEARQAALAAQQRVSEHAQPWAAASRSERVARASASRWRNLAVTANQQAALLAPRVASARKLAEAALRRAEISKGRGSTYASQHTQQASDAIDRLNEVKGRADKARYQSREATVRAAADTAAADRAAGEVLQLTNHPSWRLTLKLLVRERDAAWQILAEARAFGEDMHPVAVTPQAIAAPEARSTNARPAPGLLPPAPAAMLAKHQLLASHLPTGQPVANPLADAPQQFTPQAEAAAALTNLSLSDASPAPTEPVHAVGSPRLAEDLEPATRTVTSALQEQEATLARLRPRFAHVEHIVDDEGESWPNPFGKSVAALTRDLVGQTRRRGAYANNWQISALANATRQPTMLWSRKPSGSILRTTTFGPDPVSGQPIKHLLLDWRGQHYLAFTPDDAGEWQATGTHFSTGTARDFGGSGDCLFHAFAQSRELEPVMDLRRAAADELETLLQANDNELAQVLHAIVNDHFDKYCQAHSDRK